MLSLDIEYIFLKLYYFLIGTWDFLINFRFNIFYLFLLKLGWAVLSLVLVGWLAHYGYKLMEAMRQDREDYLARLWRTWQTQSDDTINVEWLRVQKALESDNPADWKLAIIEADTMLDSVVARMGYPGGNLGERLKAIEPSDFTTLNEAWEAHKVRNTIAHEGNYELTKREVIRVVNLYEKVFREFDCI